MDFSLFPVSVSKCLLTEWLPGLRWAGSKETGVYCVFLNITGVDVQSCPFDRATSPRLNATQMEVCSSLCRSVVPQSVAGLRCIIQWMWESREDDGCKTTPTALYIKVLLGCTAISTFLSLHIFSHLSDSKHNPTLPLRLHCFCLPSFIADALKEA